MLYPLLFNPVFKERVWGGRKLAELYQKPLPQDIPIGESWEICDRPGDVSIVANGPFAGKDLHWLMHHHTEDLLGCTNWQHKRFPLLIKILDAREKLSLQVHPPAEVAQQLQGEPKTEFWYIADADPGAELYVGLKRGVTRAEFQRRVDDGTVADCFHRLKVRTGDAMFLPSGRVHAIGAGLVIFEIQQNSDTTYRVFDWNRRGLDGKLRTLHVAESLASIDFNDFEPALISSSYRAKDHLKSRALVKDPLFSVDVLTTESSGGMSLGDGNMRILGFVNGRVKITDGDTSLELRAGQFCLIPASVRTEVRLEGGSTFLLVQLGNGQAG
jgi:mannose-6-phosphate isomerase